MSEQILDSPMSSAPASPGVLPAIDSETQPGSGGHRAFVIVGLAIVAGLIVGGMVIFVLRPFAGDEPVDTSVGAAAAAAAAAAQEQAQADQEVGEVVPRRTRVRLTSRDPFAVLVPEPPPAPPAKKSAAAQDSASSGGSTSGATVSALSISSGGDSVKLKIDGKRYSVDEGETFASSYRLYDIFNDTCAGLLYGDQNVVVCEGDSITVG